MARNVLCLSLGDQVLHTIPTLYFFKESGRVFPTLLLSHLPHLTRISPLSTSSRVDLESLCSLSNPLFSLFSHLGQHTRLALVLSFSKSYLPQHFTPCPARTSSKSTDWILKIGASLRSLLTPLLSSPSHTTSDRITFPKCKSDYVTLLVMLAW